MLVGTSNRSESLTLANARRPRTSYLIHLQVLYCHTCGCADRTSARIRIKSGRRLGAVPRSARPRCQSANVSRALNRLRHSYASTRAPNGRCDPTHHSHTVLESTRADPWTKHQQRSSVSSSRERTTTQDGYKIRSAQQLWNRWQNAVVVGAYKSGKA
jgi:hypothetical protein